MGGENEAEKVKRNFYSAEGFIFHLSQTCEKHTDIQPPVPLPHIPRLDTRGQAHSNAELNGLP